MQIASTGPAVIVPLYYVSVGLLLFTAVQSAIVGLSGLRRTLHLYFAALCVCAAGFQVAVVGMYQARTLDELGTVMRWQGALGVSVHLAFVLFAGRYTGWRFSRGLTTGLVLFFAGLVAFQLTLPFGLRWASATLGEPIRLPWGERLAQVNGTPGPANLVFRLVSLTVVAWATWAAFRMYRAGRRRSAALFGGYLALQLATIAWGVVADTGRLGGIYLAGFAFLALALLITTGMGLDLRDRNRDLARTADELSEEIRWREEAELNIRQLAYHDQLSGLPNRAQLMDHLEMALDEARESGRGGAMILIDLDHFKTINAGLSHDVGDEVLREVARRVTRAAGDDGFVARLGGDEFVVVIGDLPPEHDAAEARARDLAEATLGRLVGPLQLGARVLDVGASAGIVRFPDDAATVGDVLRRADMAVAQAKALGRNNVQFYLPALQAAADARLELERGLRVALAEGHLYLRFQPQVSATGAVIGAEVLLRWRHPELGEIGPDRFIPVAEETGLIHEVGDWVLETACERLAAWSAADSPFTGHLAVNVSGWQLIRPGFVERVERTLERFQLPPARLTLEVTESTFLYHMEEAAAQLAALREFGIRISLDDFGTGYSSLAYLQNLPLDEIKIDRAFVRQVHPGVSSPLVESIVAIGRSLRLERVAEGVELESQRRALATLGCEIFQGYLFAPPLPEDEFLAWLGAREIAPSMEA